MMVIVLNNHEVLIGNNQFLPVDLPKDIRLKYIGRRACGKQAGLEQHKPVNVRANHVDVVRDQEHGQAQFLMQMCDEFNDVVLGRDIKAGGRLIEQEDFRLLSQGTGNEYPLLLAAGQMAECRISVCVHAYVGEGIKGNGLVLFRRSLEEAQGPVATHHDSFEDSDRKVPIHDALLRKVPDLGAVVAAQLAAGTIKYT